MIVFTGVPNNSMHCLLCMCACLSFVWMCVHVCVCVCVVVVVVVVVVCMGTHYLQEEYIDGGNNGGGNNGGGGGSGGGGGGGGRPDYPVEMDYHDDYDSRPRGRGGYRGRRGGRGRGKPPVLTLTLRCKDFPVMADGVLLRPDLAEHTRSTLGMVCYCFRKAWSAYTQASLVCRHPDPLLAFLNSAHTKEVSLYVILRMKIRMSYAPGSEGNVHT